MMKKFVLLVSGLLAALSCPAFATWYGVNVEKGADIMMMDVRWPWWPESTYFANWNYHLLPGRISGYGGFAASVEAVGPKHLPNLDPEVQGAYRPSSVWSFWGGNSKGEPVRVEATSRFNYPKQYIGEGASGSLGGVWPVVRRGRWYTVLLRLWKPAGPGKHGYSYIGRWLKDVEAGRWYLYGIMRLPVEVDSFNGNAGFLEDYWFAGRSVRSLHRRLGYYRKDGRWRKADKVIYNVPPPGNTLNTYWVVDKIEKGTVLAMELSSNKALLPFKLRGKTLPLGKKTSFTLTQPDRPSLDKPAVRDVRAISTGSQVLVSWSVPPGAAPQLSYKVEIFEDARCAGPPAVRIVRRMPTTRKVLVDADLPSPAVRLTLTDVFDQQTEPVVVRAEKAPGPSPASKVKASRGLRYRMFFSGGERHVNVFYPPCRKCKQSREEKHFFVSLEEIRKARLVQQGHCLGFDLNLRGARKTGFAFVFDGLLHVPETGLYLFSMRGTDGYRIRMDGKEVLLWDGLHGPEERTFFLNLAAGDHPLDVEYFFDRRQPFFSLRWQGPGDKEFREIPVEALLHPSTGKTPVPRLSVQAVEGGLVRARVAVEAKGRKIERIQLFCDKMRIASSRGERLLFHDLLPAGRRRVWARVFYGGNHTADTEPVFLRVPSGKITGWKLGIAGEAACPRNILQVSDNAFRFIGEGEFVLYRRVQGDFTLTCRIARCLGLGGEPVNGSSWVGLTVRRDASRNNYRWRPEFGIMQTARRGIRTTPDHPDLGGGRISVQVFPKGRRWLRIVRKGRLWTAWTSADGKRWEFGTTHYKRIADSVDAGIVFRALPQDAQMYFQAAVTDLSLEKGAPPGFAFPKAVPAANTRDVPFTGIAVAPSDPEVIVLRSPEKGLLRSEDGGKTWREANGNLRGPANCVRSVAIHPTRPEVMLRAAGKAGAGGAFEGGLFLTRDGGRSWEKLDFPGDFDGLGPSALCGEVLVYLRKKPDVVLAGCETKGLFRSEDGGRTWKRILGGGRRFTAVKADPWHFRSDGRAFLHAVTCPDRFMPLLGRGGPAFAAAEEEARDYFSDNDGVSFREHCRRGDLGYLNFAFGNRSLNQFTYATTHGILFTFSNGRDGYLMRSGVEVEFLRPFTAIGFGKMKGNPWTIAYAQALDPGKPGRVSLSRNSGVRWEWVDLPSPGIPGVIAVAADCVTPAAPARHWWFLATDGLYRAEGGGKKLKKLVKVIGRR